MPTAHNGDVALHYETTASGETVVFVGDVGFGAWQWGWQFGALTGRYETLVFDHRGVGDSDSPSGPCSVSDLAGDVEAVLADAGTRRAHVVGAGLGGLVGLELAATTGRVRSLTLLGSGSAADAEPMDAFVAADPDANGVTATADSVLDALDRVLSPAFLDEYPDEARRIVEWRTLEDAAREVWLAHAAAVEGYEPPPLYEVTTPTLVVHGHEDLLWPVEDARTLAEALPRGEFVGFDDAGHLVGVERSAAVNDRLVGFVETVSDSE